MSYENEVKKVGIVTIIFNLLLSLGKIISGAFARSSSLISDGIHSFSDILSTIVIMIGAKLSRKSPDKEHPFGHERMESISTLILAFILVMTSSFLIYHSIFDLIDFFKGVKTKTVSQTALYIALSFAVLSIVIKALMYLYSEHVARKIKSESLHVDAIHHLTDSISSFASLIGIIGLLLGNNLSILDAIASIIIALFILHVSFSIAKKSISEVLDTSASDEFNSKLREDILAYPNVLGITSLKTRMFAEKVYVEIEIGVDSKISVKEGHDIALGLHDFLEEKYSIIKHCMIHIDPFN